MTPSPIRVHSPAGLTSFRWTWATRSTIASSPPSPLHVTGNANTFEATFNYSLKDERGKDLAHAYVTATSGSGERGTFVFTVPFTVEAAQDGTLSVFERSAENGAVVHERQIPLRLLP